MVVTLVVVVQILVVRDGKLRRDTEFDPFLPVRPGFGGRELLGLVLVVVLGRVGGLGLEFCGVRVGDEI